MTFSVKSLHAIHVPVFLGGGGWWWWYQRTIQTEETKDRTAKGTNNIVHRIGKKYHLIKNIKFYWKQIYITHILTCDWLNMNVVLDLENLKNLHMNFGSNS